MTAGPSPSTATQDVSPPSAPLAGQKDVDPQQQRQAGYSYYHVPDFMTIPVIGPLPTRYRTLTFSAGFLCGQASLILVAVLFLRYVVLEDPQIALREAGKRKKKRLSRSRKQRRASSASRRTLPAGPSGATNAGSGSAPHFTAAAVLPASDELILEKLSYDLSTHAAESADWLNVLVAQAVVAYRSMIVASGGEGGRGAKGYVEDIMNRSRGGGKDKGIVSLDYITVTEFDFGQEYPTCSNARVRPSNESGKMRIEVDVDYVDHVSLSVETKVLLNFPKPKFAIVPVNLALALVRFSATLTLEIPPPGSATASDTLDGSVPRASLSVSIHPDFILDLASTSLIGSRAKLQDIPKVEQLIIGRIRTWVIDNLVWPRIRTVNLPHIGGSRKEQDSRGRKGRSPSAQNGEAETDDEEAVPETDDYIFIEGGKSGLSTENGEKMGRRRGRDDTPDEEEEEYEGEEEQDEEEYDGASSSAFLPPSQPSSSRQNGSRNLAANGRSSRPAFAAPRQARPRRPSSLASSTTSSDLYAIQNGKDNREAVTSTTPIIVSPPPELSTDSTTSSSSDSTFREIYRDAILRHRSPLHSPGLGAGHKGLGFTSMQHMHLPATRSETGGGSGSSTAGSEPTSSSSRNPHDHSASAASAMGSRSGSRTPAEPFFDKDSLRWEAARRAAKERNDPVFSPDDP